jgi:NitT/TauT family transport system permease protein
MKRFITSRKPQSNNRFVSRRYKEFATAILTALFWLTVWQLASLLMGRPLLLPGPLSVLRRLGELAVTASFWRITAYSLGRIGLGFAGGLAAGILLALLTQWNKAAETLLSPLLKAILVTPVVSFSILLIIWFDNNSVPIYIVFLVVMPIVWENFRAGIRATDSQLLEMADLFQLSFGKKLRRVYVPSIIPYFMASVTSSFRLAWKSGIAAEVIASPRFAIGRAMQDGRVYLQINDVMAWTLVVILFSLALERTFLELTHKVGRINLALKAGEDS